jgi:hypothetical protein
MFLLYINELGRDYKGQRQYEFIFGKQLISLYNEKDVLELENEWLIVPSSGKAFPPQMAAIDLVGLLKNSDLELETVQNSDYFGMIDAVDGVIALGWEKFNMDLIEEHKIERVSFHFGETVESVTAKLTTRGLRLINDEIKYKLS